MEKYWAIDYINDELSECEPVYGDQLYVSEEEAETVRKTLDRPELFEVNWYGPRDIQEFYTRKITIDENLHVNCRPL